MIRLAKWAGRLILKTAVGLGLALALAAAVTIHTAGARRLGDQLAGLVVLVLIGWMPARALLRLRASLRR